MALKTSSCCHNGLPTKKSTMHPAILRIMYLFGEFLQNTLLDITPVSQDQPPPGLDMVRLKQLLVELTRDGFASAKLSVVTEPAQSCFSGKKQAEKAQAADGRDPKSPISLTPDDFKKSPPKSQFKTVIEIWDEAACKFKIAKPTDTNKHLDNSAEYVFVVRKRVGRTSKKAVSFIDINSEGLRGILRDVLEEFKAFSLMEDKLSIEQNALFHFLPELDGYAEDMEIHSDRDMADREHLLLLIEHLKHAYASTFQRLESMLQHGHITYDLLWALFKPGCHVYTTCIRTKEPRCVVFDAGEEMTRNDETWLNLECRFLDYDGAKLGEAAIFLHVAKFRGSKPIETLEACPLHHYPNHEQVQKDLIERGQKFRNLAGSHIQHCQGRAFFMNRGGEFTKVKINSRVAVDAAFFHEMQPNYSRTSLGPIGAMLMERRERKKEKMRGNSVNAQKLSEADLLVACPTVCCFSFKENIFLECAVSALRDVDWSPKPFDCLRIPSETKTLLLSLAKTRLGLIPTVPFDDVVDGKGQGFNILLNGPPGVGKTSTVEATSEYFKLPLFSISAGELVVNHGDSNALEQQLEIVFKIAKHFNAVLVLDEADAFMEQRISYHDTHNRLVTIFLRKLEYYRGILFLTSNRGIQFDDAILSRIHLFIKYEDLTTEFRRDIWSTFLLSKARTTQGPAIIKEHELQELASLALNGREIENITMLAHALAEVGVKQVNHEYLMLAAKFNSKKFGRERHADGMYV